MCHIKYSNAGEHSRNLHPSVVFERCGNERAWKISTEGMNWRCAVAPGSSPETRSWLFGLPESGALTLSSGIGLFVMSQCTGGKKTKKESWMNFRLKHMTNQAQNDPPTPLSRTKLRTWSRVTTNSGSKMARQIGARLHRGCLHAIRCNSKDTEMGLLWSP